MDLKKLPGFKMAMNSFRQELRNKSRTPKNQKTQSYSPVKNQTPRVETDRSKTLKNENAFVQFNKTPVKLAKDLYMYGVSGRLTPKRYQMPNYYSRNSHGYVSP